MFVRELQSLKCHWNQTENDWTLNMNIEYAVSCAVAFEVRKICYSDPKKFFDAKHNLTINNFILITNSLMLEHWTRLLKIYGRFCSFLRILLLLTFFATFLLSKIWNHNKIWLFWHRNWHGCKKFGHVCIFLQTLDWLSLKSKQFFCQYLSVSIWFQLIEFQNNWVIGERRER